MKHLRVALWSLLGLVGCGAVHFDLTRPIPEHTIAGSTVGGLLPSFIQEPFSLDIDLKYETQRQGTGPATQAFLKSVQLQITSPASGTFDFLEEVHLYISAPSLQKTEIASAKAIADGQQTLDFAIVSSLDLLQYLNAGAELSATATGTQPTQETRFDGTVVIDVRI